MPASSPANGSKKAKRQRYGPKKSSQRNHPPLTQAAWIVILLGLLIECLLILVSLFHRLQFELQGPYNVDSPVYWAIGRGIANGLTLYRDLYDNKAPGIFLVSAASIALRGDYLLGSLLDALLIGGVPVVIVLVAIRQSRAFGKIERTACVLLSLLFGCAVALYTARFAGQYQVESFGVFFVVVYAAVLAWDDRPLGWTRVLLASAALGFSIAFKEPFLLAAAACALLEAKKPRFLLRSLLLPFVLVTVAGILCLRAIGSLDGYVNIYLRFMFGDFALRGGTHVWERGMQITRLIAHVARYSPLLLLLIIGSAGILIVRLHGLRPRFILWKSLCLLLALYFLSTAVGLGGSYYSHYFVLAVPGYVGLFFGALRWFSKDASATGRANILAGAGIICIVFSLYAPSFGPVSSAAGIQKTANVRHIAYNFDSILDRCGESRYLYLGKYGIKPYAFTRHSPLGPLFMQMWPLAPKPLQATVLENVQHTDIILLSTWPRGPLGQQIRTAVEAHFDAQPWPCAGSSGDKHAPYVFLFRKRKSQ